MHLLYLDQRLGKYLSVIMGFELCGVHNKRDIELVELIAFSNAFLS
jgi:hypothetical protein